MFEWFNNDNNTKHKVLVQPISLQMLPFYQAVKNHLEMDTSGALLITGDWGSGKTHFMKKILFPNLEKESEWKPILVSLYGATDKNSIASKVFMAYLDKLGKNQPISTASLTKGAYNILESFTYLKKFVDVNKLFAGSGEDLFRFLPSKGLLICFDDLERISEKINAEDFLGMVNELVENQGNKVVIIANEGTIKGGIKYKEKTIEKTIHFRNDQSAIFDSLVSKYQPSTFGKYLVDHKDFMLKSLDPRDTDDNENADLKIQFGNIRSIKFAVEHFRYVFEIIESKTDITLPLVIEQLNGLWAFILAVTTEFKKNDSISFTERKKLDATDEPFSTDELAKMIWGNNQNQVAEDAQPDEWTFRENFIKVYFQRIGMEYRYSPQVYDLLTAGESIEPDSFIAEIDLLYHAVDGQVNPAHELLSKFLHQGYWHFTNEEFIPALNELLDYAREGSFDDVLGILNAASFLNSFNDVMELSKAELVQQIKAGIDVVSEKIELENAFNQLDMAGDGFQGADLKEIFDYALERFKAVRQQELTAETQALEQQFREDLPTFFVDLEPENPNVIIPERKLFDQFNTEGLDQVINNWQPSEMIELVRFFNRRYFKSSFAERLTDEIPFLQALAQNLQAFDNPDKILSKKLIDHQLLPKVQKSIEKLQSFGNQAPQQDEL